MDLAWWGPLYPLGIWLYSFGLIRFGSTAGQHEAY